MTFCVECGREGPVVGGLCATCYRERHPPFRPPETVDVPVCNECGRTEVVAGRWTRADVEAAIPEVLKARIAVDPAASRATFTHDARQEDPRNLLLTVKAVAVVGGVEVADSFRVRLRVKGGLCPTCHRKRSKYFEGIVQVRATDRAVTPEERDRLVGFLEAAVERRARKGEEVFISKVEDVRGGADVYLSSNTAARTIARELAEEVGGSATASPKLHGRRKGKDLYRVTYLVRIPE